MGMPCCVFRGYRRFVLANDYFGRIIATRSKLLNARNAVGDGSEGKADGGICEAYREHFYFLTDVASHNKDDEVSHHPNVCLAFAESKGQE
jgi:hypothetical protein